MVVVWVSDSTLVVSPPQAASKARGKRAMIELRLTDRMGRLQGCGVRTACPKV
jgi:hypothetical protein